MRRSRPRYVVVGELDPQPTYSRAVGSTQLAANTTRGRRNYERSLVLQRWRTTIGYAVPERYENRVWLKAKTRPVGLQNLHFWFPFCVGLWQRLDSEKHAIIDNTFLDSKGFFVLFVSSGMRLEAPFRVNLYMNSSALWADNNPLAAHSSPIKPPRKSLCPFSCAATTSSHTKLSEGGLTTTTAAGMPTPERQHGDEEGNDNSERHEDTSRNQASEGNYDTSGSGDANNSSTCYGISNDRLVPAANKG